VDKSVLAKLRFANDRRVDFASYDAVVRVARVLRELAAVYGERSGNRVLLNWPLTQTELASLASVAEPTVQKALRRLRGLRRRLHRIPVADHRGPGRPGRLHPLVTQLRP
jgi:CRP-like cAMP-binding protein